MKKLRRKSLFFWFSVIPILSVLFLGVSSFSCLGNEHGDFLTKEVSVCAPGKEIHIVYEGKKVEVGFMGRRVVYGDPASMKLTLSILHEEKGMPFGNGGSNLKTLIHLLSSFARIGCVPPENRPCQTPEEFLNRWLYEDFTIVRLRWEAETFTDLNQSILAPFEQRR